MSTVTTDVLPVPVLVSVRYAADEDDAHVKVVVVPVVLKSADTRAVAVTATWAELWD
jgi:hypothetical protein